MTGCGDLLPEEVPNPIYVEGLLNNGWSAFEAKNYEEALDYFQQAIDSDVQSAEAYLGAGWSSLYLGDYWGKANEYFYMALQIDGGQAPLVEHLTEIKVQDVDFTTFELLEGQVSDIYIDSLGILIGLQGDTLVNWPFPGDTTAIRPQTPGRWMYGTSEFDQGDSIFVGPQLGNVPLDYRFGVDNSGLITLLTVSNVPLAIEYKADSISDGWAYITVPLERIDDPESAANDSYEWLMPGAQCNYDYVTLNVGEGYTQVSKDAMAGWTLLQELRGENGNALLGVANGQALGSLFASYTFDEGSIYGDGVSLDINLDNLVGNAALVAYEQQRFHYAWFLCKTRGVGTGLDPEADTFELDLIQVIEDLVAS
jgi:hypothetical protein